MLRLDGTDTTALLAFRLKLFGITGAATHVLTGMLTERLRLKLFGITGAATLYRFVYYSWNSPPQTLWNHGCCDSLLSERL